MEFKKGNYINEKTLTKEEAIEFIDFLESEMERHRQHMLEYQQIALDEYASTFMRIVAGTVVTRNIEDIEHTKKTINYLLKKYWGVDID